MKRYTNIFAGLVSQLVGGSHGVHISSCWGWVVAILSIIAPVLTAVRKVLHNAEDAEHHRAGMDYNNHLRRLDRQFPLEICRLGFSRWKERGGPERMGRYSEGVRRAAAKYAHAYRQCIQRRRQEVPEGGEAGPLSLTCYFARPNTSV